jgi:hypothetical protein
MFKIIKRDYENDYVVIDEKGQKNHQCNSICIIKVKKTRMRTATEAEVNAGQISLYCIFSQSSHGSSSNSPAHLRNARTTMTTGRQQEGQRMWRWARQGIRWLWRQRREAQEGDVIAVASYRSNIT